MRQMTCHTAGRVLSPAYAYADSRESHSPTRKLPLFSSLSLSLSISLLSRAVTRGAQIDHRA
eukprot:SAG31_NODE_20425_length_575_cov_0.621849_1_plen_61_part_01